MFAYKAEKTKTDRLLPKKHLERTWHIVSYANAGW